GQAFQVLQALLEKPQEIVTREELRERLWPDNTFVDYELALRKAVNRVRDVLGDSAENPRFIETLPRRGYRFLASVESVNGTSSTSSSVQALRGSKLIPAKQHSRVLPLSIGVAALLLAVVGVVVYERRQVSAPHVQRTLTRLTFDDGLQIGATWSPD